jgi:glutamine amidotransferase
MSVREPFEVQVTIVDAGIGNVRSVQRMFEEIDADARLVSDPIEAADAERLVLPGVGAFDAGMRALNDGGWRLVLDKLAKDRKIPVLGICLGMQLLGQGSDVGEGAEPGLGWIAARARRIDTGGDPRLKVPHMGWAEVTATRPNPLIGGEDGVPRFYHVHSYRLVCDDPADEIGTATYGSRFTTAVQRGNIMGVQFHPEKSHRFGKELLRRFLAVKC